MTAPSRFPGAHIERITTTDNISIVAHRIGTPTGPTILLVPGTFSNATFWLGTRATGFARFLAGNGYDVWCLEPRGHGESDRPSLQQRWDFDDWIRRDLPAALHACTSHTGSVVFIGHSAGGAAIIAALAADPALQAKVRGAVIVSTPLPWLQSWRGIGARLIRAVSRRLRAFPARLLGLGPEDELPGVMIQWMTWNIDARWLAGDGLDYGARLPDVTVPLLVLAGQGDRIWAPPDACRGLFDMAGSADKTFLTCGTQTGFSHDFDHVDILVGRAAREEVWPLILDWTADKAGPGVDSQP